ncbi:hypothetical protein K502DRAFT_353920 [Neoconidiobolus thromboides FSU 785]|nr:hypothetical protein K502DRAFT_353920 [Neoconidiobolus thromboides FSU 785]
MKNNSINTITHEKTTSFKKSKDNAIDFLRSLLSPSKKINKTKKSKQINSTQRSTPNRDSIRFDAFMQSISHHIDITNSDSDSHRMYANGHSNIRCNFDNYDYNYTHNHAHNHSHNHIHTHTHSVDHSYHDHHHGGFISHSDHHHGGLTSHSDHHHGGFTSHSHE